MTLAEQREKLVEAMATAMCIDMFALHELPVSDELWHLYKGTADAALATISAAGFSIVGPEVTAEMREAVMQEPWTMAECERAQLDPMFGEEKRYAAMLAAGDLARKPE